MTSPLITVEELVAAVAEGRVSVLDVRYRLGGLREVFGEVEAAQGGSQPGGGGVPGGYKWKRLGMIQRHLSDSTRQRLNIGLPAVTFADDTAGFKADARDEMVDDRVQQVFTAVVVVVNGHGLDFEQVPQLAHGETLQAVSVEKLYRLLKDQAPVQR